MYALDNILEAWILVLHSHSFGNDRIKQYSKEMFNKYLQCHLAPPDGIRQHHDNEEEIEGNEQNDGERFEEQLILMGVIGREDPAHSLMTLCRCIEERTQRLQNQLQRIYAAQNLDSENSKQLETLYEDIHWLILISGHVLSIKSVSEEPLIPKEMVKYSLQQATNGTTDVTTTLKVLAAPGQSIGEIQNADATCDLTIRMVAAVFRICEIENKAIEANMKSVLSPEICTNIMWFLSIWSESYLLISDEYYEISESLQSAFGRDTPGGNWTMGFILNKISINVRNFYMEKQLVDTSTEILVALVKNRKK